MPRSRSGRSIPIAHPIPIGAKDEAVPVERHFLQLNPSLSCMVLACVGVNISLLQRRDLRDKFDTAAPRPRTPFETSYNERKLRPRCMSV